MILYTPVAFYYFESLAKTFISRARQNQVIRKNFFNRTTRSRIAIAMNTNPAVSRSYIESPLWCQKIDPAINNNTGGQPIVDFDAADNCR